MAWLLNFWADMLLLVKLKEIYLVQIITEHIIVLIPSYELSKRRNIHNLEIVKLEPKV